MTLIVGVSLLASVLCAVPAAANKNEKKASICGGKDWNECSEAVRAQQRESFGLRSLRTYRKDKVEVLRAFVRGSFGGSYLSLTFLRDGSEIPKVEIRRQLDRYGTNWYAPLISRMSETSWQEILKQGQQFDAELTGEERERICTDGETYTVEAIDRAGNIRTRVEHSCSEGPTQRYFDTLTRIAVAQFPFCAALDPEEFGGGDHGRLVSCSRLDGDRMTAAEFHNQLERSNFDCCLDSKESAKIEHMFDYDISFAWPGRPVVRDKANAAKMWINESIADREIYADTQNSVRLMGIIQICETKKADVTEVLEAPFTTTWKRGHDGQFRMQSFSYAPDQIILERSYTRAQYEQKRRSKVKWPPRREILRQPVVISTVPSAKKYDDLGECNYG